VIAELNAYAEFFIAFDLGVSVCRAGWILVVVGDPALPAF